MTTIDTHSSRRGSAFQSASGDAVPARRQFRRLVDTVLAKDAGATKAWYGVLALAALCSWLGYVGVRTLMSQSDLAGAISSARGRTVGPILLVFIGVILLAEQLWPAVRRPLFSRAQVVDAIYLVLFAAVVLPLLTVVETGAAIEIGQYAHFLELGRLPLGPQVVVAGLILVGIDALNWAAHVANHRSLTLWRLHALHHSQEDMSVLTTFRTHPLVHASYLPSLLPALVLGASGTVPAVAIIVYGCLITLPHANLRWRFGPLGRVFVSPAYHRLHHVAVFLDDRGTVNYGFVLVCWDQLIHRAVFPIAGESPATGIAGRPVPVEQVGPLTRTPRVILAQLAQPFTRRAATDGPS
jgi:sterol desaturase/sphingolipid hydroxylase (fatty acid hydroxylase superfamily)